MDTTPSPGRVPAGAPPDQRVETLIVGAGQAGLSVAYHLQQRGLPAMIVEERERVGDNWRRHYDSLRLYNPARYCGLPGMPMPIDGWSFPTKDDMADYLEAYAARFELDVRTGVHVAAIERDGERYLARTSAGVIRADHVVVASGTFGGPSRPPFAADLDPDILQLHSIEYRNPRQLRPGPVLVVGASHSGADVAVEVAPHHPTILCGPSRGEIPVELEGPFKRLFFPVVWFLWGHVLTIRTPIGRKMRPHVRSEGGPLLRYRSGDLAAAGVERVTDRVVGVADGLPVLEDGRRLEVANVVWCTGLRHDLSWIDLPVVGDDGWPLEHRGVVEDHPGLYFAGLAFQWSFRSMLVGGAGDDAAHLVRHIAKHRRAGLGSARGGSARGLEARV